MRKIRIIKNLLLFLFVFLFISSLFSLILLIKNVSLYPLKFASSNLSSTICSIKCLGKVVFNPLFVEVIKIIVISFLIFSVVFSFFKTLKSILKTNRFIRERRRGIETVSKFGIRINVFCSELPLAFTAGFFKPEIYVSSSLIDSLNEDEIRGMRLFKNGWDF